MATVKQDSNSNSGNGKTVLIVGGGGPTGPLIINALIERGYQVSVLNTGRHPVDYVGEVERIIADPHFIEPLEDALQSRTFDIALAQYGRLRLVAQALAGKVEHFIAIGGMFYPGWIDPAATVRPTSETGEERDWSVQYLDEAMPVDETTTLHPVGKFGARVVEADNDVRQRHANGDFIATTLRYPRVYGPRQPGAAEWSIIRRILDGRQQILVPEGGFIIQSVLYVENAARIVLAMIDNRDVAGGQIFNCADPEPITHRKWIKHIAAAMNADIELVSAPMAQAKPCWPYARFPLTTGHHILNVDKLYQLDIETVPFATGIKRTVDWYLEDPDTRGKGVEPQLGDSFPYQEEDQLFNHVRQALSAIDTIEMPTFDMAHTYRHPKK